MNITIKKENAPIIRQ